LAQGAAAACGRKSCQPAKAARSGREHTPMDVAAQDDEPSGIATGWWFNVLRSVLVFANVQVVAMETNHGCTAFECTIEERLPWYVFDHLFTVLFLADLVIAVASLGPFRYFRGDPLEDKMGLNVLNILDFVVVILRAVDVWILTSIGIDTGIKLISLLRVVLISRCARHLQLHRGFRELWLAVDVAENAAKALVWVSLTLALLIWVSGTFLAKVVGRDHTTPYNFGRSAWSKDEYWGTVPKSMYSMFQVLTGDRWSDSLVLPLIRENPALLIIFVLFWCAAVLAVLNTSIGIVVETGLARARVNEEKQAKDKKQRDAVIMESMREIFRQADKDNTNDLDLNELQAALEDPLVRDRIKMLGISINDVYLLHELLDGNRTGKVDTTTFFRGCSRLQGPAMAFDLYQRSVDLKHYIYHADARIHRMDELNDTLAALLHDIEEVDTDIVKGDQDARDPVLAARRERSLRTQAQTLKNDYLTRQFTREVSTASRVSTKGSLLKASLRAASKAPGEPKSPPRGAYMQPDVQPPPPPTLPLSVEERRINVMSAKGFQWPT